MSPVRRVRTINLLSWLAAIVFHLSPDLPPPPILLWFQSSGVLWSFLCFYFKFITYSEDYCSEKFKLLLVFKALASIPAAARTDVVFKSRLFYLVKFQTSRFDLTGALSLSLSIGVSLKHVGEKKNPIQQFLHTASSSSDVTRTSEADVPAVPYSSFFLISKSVNSILACV